MSGNLALYTGGWSKHFDEAEDNIYVDEFNEDHKLLGVQYEGFIVGQFYNSYNHKNYLLGYALENKHLLFINGFATNYTSAIAAQQLRRPAYVTCL
jgi:L-rhamnose isomerase